MFAIGFDLVVAEAARSHPKGAAQAYYDHGKTLNGFGFKRIPGSVFITESDDMANLFAALLALRELPWFPTTVRDIRAFRVEQWSDFTSLMKQP